MRPLRILAFIGFIAVFVGLAVRFWIDALPPGEPFWAALPQIPTRAPQVVIASEQPSGPAASARSSRRPQRTRGPGPSFTTIRSGQAAVPPAAGARNALTHPRAGGAPSSPPRTRPPAPPPAAPPKAPVAAPTPPSPSPPSAPAAPAAPAASPAAAPAAAPTTRAKPSREKKEHASRPKANSKRSNQTAPTQASESPQPPTPAEPSSDTSKPGSGHGDKNHDHSGPPGAKESDKKDSDKKDSHKKP